MTGGEGDSPGGSETDAILIFCHCPKTAGTSLFRAVRQVIGSRRSYLATRSRPDVAALRTRGIRFIAGHVPYPHYQAQPGLEAARFVTIVRDPEQVMLSLFRHYRRRRSLSATARRFFESELPEAGIGPDTQQAVSLFFRRVAPSEPFLADNPQVRFAVDKMTGPVGREDLEQARRNLAAMDVVGSTGRLADSLLLMALRFGWPGLRHGRYNASRQTDADMALPADVKALCALDKELVDWAERRLGRSLEEAQAQRIRAGQALPTIAFHEAPRRLMSMGWLREWAATVRMYTRDDWRWWIGTKAALLRHVGTGWPRHVLIRRAAPGLRGAKAIHLAWRFVVTLAVGRQVGIWPRLAVIAGISYLFLPVDLIPDRIPFFGHLDEAGFMALGFMLAWLLMPPDNVPLAVRGNTRPKR